ncbi:hypothetical protein [Microbacterium sp. NPDC086615]|uniref:hypothetical protein n=1 Tax=Microbacterium sp. NPDC086615 TaxID=3154865 RepID=UPI003415957D
MIPIRPQPGSSRSLSSFVGRIQPTEDALQMLERGVDLLVSDPRRMGKTQFLRYLAREAASDWVSVMIDFEDVHTATAFLERAAQALSGEQALSAQFRQTVLAFFRTFEGAEVGVATVGSLKLSAAFEGQDPLVLLDRIVSQLDRERADGRGVLLLLDEVPIAIRNIERREGADAARSVLQTLRRLTQTTRHVRWVVCGSIGFHHVLRAIGATQGDINSLTNLPLGPLAESESWELANRLLLGAGCAPGDIDDESVRTHAEECGAIPFLMHHLGLLIEQRGWRAPTPAQVRSAFVDLLNDHDGSHAVDHFVERLDENYGANAALARAILDAIAQGGAVTASEIATQFSNAATAEDIGQILDLLTRDHYLRMTSRRFEWRYTVIKRIWAHRRHLETVL